MPDRAEKMICLGVLTRPHGIKGEFCLNLYADSPTLLSGPITLKKPDGTEKPCTAEGFRPHKNAWLVTIRGVNDRTQAEALAGSTLWLPRHCLPALNENEAYITDLLGRPVALTDGTVLGTFDHIETPGGQMLWAIRSAGSEFLFPARPEFISSLGTPIVIDPPEGLVEACTTPLRS